MRGVKFEVDWSADTVHLHGGEVSDKGVATLLNDLEKWAGGQSHNWTPAVDHAIVIVGIFCALEGREVVLDAGDLFLEEAGSDR